MRYLFLTISRFRSFPAYKRAVGTGECLAQRGHAVAIAALDCPENRERMAKEAPHCEPLWFKGGNFLQEVFSKAVAARQWNPDVIYSTSYSPRNAAFFRFLLPWKIEVIAEFSELYSQYGETQLWWKFVERFATLENSRILAASKVIERRFKHLASECHAKTPVIYSPYAYPEYLSPTAVVPSQKSVVFMAGLFKNYGVYDVIDACARLMRKDEDFHLEILGGGPEKESARKLVGELGLVDRIHIRGYVPEEKLNDYFSKASVFVSPLHDTIQDVARCPSKVFYYIPYNKPIVTCALGDPLETLGEYGYYYRPDDIDDMATAISRGLKDSVAFSYPRGFIEKHSWMARAVQFEKWMEGEK